MPPRWPRKPDRNDPDFRRLDDRMNFAVHVAICITINSGLWFVSGIKNADWPWATWFTLTWVAILLLHLIYILAIADYSLESDG
ncbi:MAG: 2TM domain-containing protein [Cyanobacteria bacterium P01_E01_bin.42]